MVAAASQASGVKSRVAALVDDWQDMFVVAALLTLFWLVHRQVEVVEFGGDAVAKWQFARQWWHHFDWAHANLDHHSGRMGVNAVAWLAQALFGRGWRSYYIAPFFVAMLQLPFAYAIGKRLVNRLAGVLAVLLITYLQTVHRSASQLLPDGFAGSYAIVAAYFCLRFADPNEPKRRQFLIGMGVMGFVGYLAKETFVFFFPGMVIAVWLARKNLRDVATFLGVMFGGFLLETAFYSGFTKYSSRYQVVRSVHGADGDWHKVTFAELFDRFARMPDGWKYLLFFTFGSGLWLLALNRHERLAGRALAIIGFSQVFFLTFLVRSFNPIEMWESFEPRYIDPFTPFAATMSGAFLAHVCTTLWEEQTLPAWVAKWGPGRAALAPFWLVAFVGLAGYAESALAKPSRAPNAIALGRKLSRVLNDAYRRNLPVAQPRNIKVLAVMYDVYLDDELLLKDGQLPSVFDVVRREHGHSYVVKSPEAYPRGKFGRMLEAGCVVVVSRNRGGQYEASSWDVLPPTCEELLADAPQQVREAPDEGPPPAPEPTE